ncbi:MAG: hypothetical protein REJ23_11405 [Brevundimonas sp.]|nr:hypothetical protein [Brevundimonas sp.]
MNAARLAAPLVAVVVMGASGWASPVRAQDFPFQGLAQMDAMNTLHANVRDQTLRASGADTTPRQWRGQSRSDTATPTPAPARPADLAFRRDPAVTRQVQAELVQTVSRSAPEAGQEIATLFRSADPISTASPALRRFGLDTGNVVDAVALYYLAMWGAANNFEETMTTTQARGARAHVARAVNFDGMGLNTPAARQRFAETLIYQALLMDAAIEQAQDSGDAAAQRTLSDAAHGQMRRMGLDMRRLQITGEGFVPR